jgi:hypothetical protein
MLRCIYITDISAAKTPATVAVLALALWVVQQQIELSLLDSYLKLP